MASLCVQPRETDLAVQRQQTAHSKATCPSARGASSMPDLSSPWGWAFTTTHLLS